MMKCKQVVPRVQDQCCQITGLALQWGIPLGSLMLFFVKKKRVCTMQPSHSLLSYIP